MCPAGVKLIKILFSGGIICEIAGPALSIAEKIKGKHVGGLILAAGKQEQDARKKWKKIPDFHINDIRF